MGAVTVATVALTPGHNTPNNAPRPAPDTAARPATGAPTASAPTAGGPAAGGSGRGGGANQRVVSVVTGSAQKTRVPFRVDSIGSVQSISTVTVRSRVESQIMEVLVSDGAIVKSGDILFKLDSRAIEAQIRQSEATVAKDKVLIEQATRIVRRQEELQAKQVGALSVLEDSRSSLAGAQAQAQADQAQLDNLRVSLSFYTIRAPIDGHVGSVGLKVGNIAKTGDASVPLVVINQFKPIYVSFSVPQRYLDDLRDAMTKDSATVTVTPQGLTQSYEGKVAFVDNTFDAASGTVAVRAIFENADEGLWPGTLCSVRITMRSEDGITVPREAVQTGQSGTFVFVVEDGVAKVRPVTISRQIDKYAVVTSGLTGTETVVTDGQVSLVNGVRVEVRGSGASGAKSSDSGGGPSQKSPAPESKKGAS